METHEERQTVATVNEESQQISRKCRIVSTRSLMYFIPSAGKPTARTHFPREFYAEVLPFPPEHNNKRQKHPPQIYRNTPPYLERTKHLLAAMAHMPESISGLPDHDWRVLTHRASNGRLPPPSLTPTQRSACENTNGLSSQFSRLLIRHDEDLPTTPADMAVQARVFNVEITNGGPFEPGEDDESLFGSDDEEGTTMIRALATEFGLHHLEHTTTGGNSGQWVDAEAHTGRRGAIDMNNDAQRTAGTPIAAAPPPPPSYTMPVNAETEMNPSIIEQLQLDHCGICKDKLTEPSKTNCGHVFCTECIMSWIRSFASGPSPNCPTCRSRL